MVAVLTAPLGLQADSVVSVLPLLLVLTLVPPLPLLQSRSAQAMALVEVVACPNRL